MKAAAAVLLLLAVPLCTAAGRDSKATPIEKVVEMLNGMVEKAKDERHAEEVQYGVYKMWCDDASASTQKDIDDAVEQIEMLEADIQKAESEASRLGGEISQHEAEVLSWQEDAKAAASVREQERADYQVTHTDYTESIAALQQAISALKSKQQAASLLQRVQAIARLPKRARQTITLFLEGEQDPDSGIVEAPAAEAYEFQSGGIIDMLEQLLDKFKDERTKLEAEEVERRHASDTLQQDLKNSIDTGTRAIEQKTQTKQEEEQAAITAKADLQDTVTSKEADEKYLAEVNAECEQKAGDFEARQQLRGEEIEALEKAIEIISSESVSGKAEAHIRKSALLQIRRDAHGQPAQLRVADYLAKQGQLLGSRTLSVLAATVRADPFAKVKKLIEELITRLMTQAEEETTHKGWCDTELATNGQTRKDKSALADKLRSEIDELTASAAKLGEELETLKEEVATLDAAVGNATEIRTQESEKNSITIKDAQEGQVAVGEALTILKDFYAKAAEATAMVQKQPKRLEKPEIFGDEPFKGQQAESGGVIGMLEVIQSDFARLEAETSASEEQAAKAHAAFLHESELTKVQKEKDIEHKTTEKANQEADILEKKQTLETTETELNAALEYYEKLKPTCMAEGMSYAERRERRKQEIEALQEALRILSDPTQFGPDAA